MLTDESIPAEMQRLVKGTGKPASTLALSVRLEVSQNCIQKRVRRLEDAHQVHRPLGKRNGYMPLESAAPRVLITKDEFPIRGQITTIDRKRKNAYYVMFEGEGCGGWYEYRHLRLTMH